MEDIEKRFAALGVKVPDILLPGPGLDLGKWAVIACDQYTQDKSYWNAVKAAADGAPSAFNLILPEIFLGEPDKKERIRAIHAAMENYLKNGVFSPPQNRVIYIERSTPHHPLRRGLVLAVDLEKYDWKSGTRPLIRATEETIAERLPPRMEIRRGASLETPHILLLMDDEKDDLLSALGERAKKQPRLYDAGLMMNSGRVMGWALDSLEDLALLADGLEKLAGKTRGDPFLFAVGDGNHSLASAKAFWEEYKEEHKNKTGIENHPARWALVELENLYDPGLSFEPIHRIIFGAGPGDLLKAFDGLEGLTCRIDASENRVIHIESSSSEIATAGLQPLLDNFVKRRKGRSIDYIHGEEEIFRLVKDPERQAVGLILPPVKKDGLFKTVAKSGSLPRKSFSMGSAEEKRFYLECRSLSE